MDDFHNVKDTTTNNKNFKKKFNKKKFSKIISYVLVGLICSILGGGISTLACLYIIPKSSAFTNTPLYENIIKNANTNSPSLSASTVSSSKGGLTVSEIAKKVGPVVVGVSVKSTSSYSNGFFDNGSESNEEDGMGSGIIISNDGYILTNYHVISNANRVTVILNNKTEVPAKVINYDSALDVAVIKVTKDVKMPAVAELGSSDNMQVGDSVVAIGNPLGKELLGSVTSGIISSTNRQISVGNSSQTLLQTDAAINPGNSGGALVNSLGQVIGINSAKVSGSGVEGLGFAIPIDIVKPKINSLLKPILKIGFAGRDITPEVAKEYNKPEGVYVVQLEEFSPAEKCGLQPGDIITKFDGKSVKSVNDINKIKASHNSGDTVKIEISRDGKNKTLSLKLSE
ncbi:trypsin-like peptidase domain-containing protein [Clostridium sp. JN-1]|jgi:serine protease Do|uniref:S1C family serine protease n=1 Tax=Clostridium sp. JN-1 TaxID=2483110 RepID=UPI000F0B54F8|nr:trypsin-like peptidase domain-containing protein [Clostridium sp. JN-1]